MIEIKQYIEKLEDKIAYLKAVRPLTNWEVELMEKHLAEVLELQAGKGLIKE